MTPVFLGLAMLGVIVLAIYLNGARPARGAGLPEAA
jgi:hypothetical protein